MTGPKNGNGDEEGYNSDERDLRKEDDESEST